ncbi:T9SS type A sorting domain-containing protein [Pontibacter roseus]|uniref:T9SS type A sorting domain-containing protein n=1 Tax=Pontibacter roseus TaxID=336989 RepID=UPI0003A2973A|nr:T9SS type A sorting domain-containing protein [Pontibacter roseus]
MRNFTRLFLTVALVASHLTGYTVLADGCAKDAGAVPVSTGGASAWKAMPEKRAEVNARAENARSRTKVYSAAVNRSLYLTEVAYASQSQFVVNSYLAMMPASLDARNTPSINAYPNPSRGITRVSLSQVGMAESYKLKISNTIGKVMETHELPVAHSSDFILDMSGYPAGVYFYSLLVNNKTVETKRLILQK